MIIRCCECGSILKRDGMIYICNKCKKFFKQKISLQEVFQCFECGSYIPRKKRSNACPICFTPVIDSFGTLIKPDDITLSSGENK